MQCTDCNHQSEDPEALFCSQCGKYMYQEGRCFCCGKLLVPDANFCSRCGTPATAKSTEDISQIPSSVAAVFPRLSTANSEQSGYDEVLKNIIDKEVKFHIAQAQVNQQAETTNQTHQDELLKYGIRDSDWVVINEGDFLMGSPESERDRFSNESQHSARVEPFEMLKTPVTFDMFDIFCDEVQHSKPADETWGREDHPVINVSYWSAMEYCYWLSKRSGRNVSLPTEAEWEFACRAGTTTPFWTGVTITTEQANFDGNYTYGGSSKGRSLGRTSPIDSYPPNPWGLHDMHGNVWEWCSSVFSEEYAGLEFQDAGDDQDDLRERVVRGGSWHNVPGGLRSASRNKLRPNYHYLRVGFRIVREIAQ